MDRLARALVPQDDIDRAVRTLAPGVRIRHREVGWTGVVVERPADAHPGVCADAIWIQADGSEHGPVSWAPFATVGEIDPYSGPVNDRFTVSVEKAMRDLGWPARDRE